jgi:hypothetical protein
MFAFVAAVLITALIFRVVADGFTAEEPIHTATGVAAKDQEYGVAAGRVVKLLQRT